ncbi:MAG: diaminopimelate decarboxylase, partial [Bacillota bacterium]|nr:diaminopimelate decarboxylase [Bacillota bacterium]
SSDLFLTSNDTPAIEFQKAKELGAIINLDDITHIDFLEKHVGIPEKICCRYNPGPLRTGNSIIGNPVEAKYGFTRNQILEGFEILRKKGVKKFAIHTMVASNELNIDYFLETARMMFEFAVEIKEKLNIDLNTINLGGGLGIPYYPDEKAIDLNNLAAGVMELYRENILDKGLYPSKLAFESGRMMTGPYGYLVTKMIHKKDTYKNYACLDACMADLMRPALYGAYHHITVVGKEDEPNIHKYDVVGSLCENNDKFAIDRYLPKLDIGDILVFHDTGAHGHAMGFNYNGKLRPAEVLWQGGKESKLIRRAETL